MCAKKDLKKEILDTARVLFNENSWANTSLRKIANELGISDGNLRYHYKTKEEIVLSLFGAMAEELGEVIATVGKDFEDLPDNFISMFKRMYKYRFLFVESYFIRKEYPSYSILFYQLMESRRMLFLSEFERLKEEGVLLWDFSDDQYELLFEQLFLISDSWMKYITTDDEAEVNKLIGYYANLCFALLTPYLNTKK